MSQKQCRTFFPSPALILAGPHSFCIFDIWPICSLLQPSEFFLYVSGRWGRNGSGLGENGKGGGRVRLLKALCAFNHSSQWVQSQQLRTQHSPVYSALQRHHGIRRWETLPTSARIERERKLTAAWNSRRESKAQSSPDVTAQRYQVRCGPSRISWK